MWVRDGRLGMCQKGKACACVSPRVHECQALPAECRPGERKGQGKATNPGEQQGSAPLGPEKPAQPNAFQGLRGRLLKGGCE